MGKILFYSDESEHTRKITSKSLTSLNFSFNFVYFFIGIREEDLSSFEKDYSEFENKWEKIYNVNELKSNVVKLNKYKYGLVSFKDDNIKFYTVLFELLKKYNVHLHFDVFNKVEYLINNMMKETNINDEKMFIYLSYSITKSLCVYRPKGLLNCIGSNSDLFLKEFKSFLEKRIKLNNRERGQSEINAFYFMLEVLTSLKSNYQLNWNYDFSFMGLKNYLKEMKINEY